jgi:diguanylate cyclase (GGDEF)-like protein
MRYLKSLYAAVLTLLVTVALGIWIDERNDELHRQHRDIQVGLEQMLRFNQELTHLLSAAVLERNILRARGYEAVNESLSVTRGSVTEASKQLQLSTEIDGLGLEHAALRVIEKRALDLMLDEQWPEARNTLFSDEYLLARKVYEINSESVAMAMTSELNNLTQRFEWLRQASLGFRLAALLLLLWVGAMFSRQLRAELQLQVALRDDIRAANTDLELKIQQRTADLAEANHKLEALSVTDGLTQLANRRHFDQAFDQEWQRAVRQGSPVSLVMIDVDHFKAYNDHYGHLAGDECLKQLAAVLQRTVRRAGELAARYGGEEFVVLLPGHDVDSALTEAQRIRTAVESLSLPHKASDTAEVLTLSLGVASRVPQLAEDPYGLVQQADEALYLAKHQGRNRVVVHPSVNYRRASSG